MCLWSVRCVLPKSGPRYPAMHTDRMTWVLVAASSAVVAYQFHTSPLTGAFATMAVTAAYLAGSGLAGSQPWSLVLPYGLWLAVEGASARGLSLLVRRGARAADRMVAEAERVRRSAAVADARRADEREYLAALHDTASATLLMVGSGVVLRRETWLCEQAARDLDVISGRTGQVDGELDLVMVLRDVVERVPLRIDWRSVEPVPVPATVAVALGHSTREALTNVVRHAGVDAAEVVVIRRGVTVVVEVRDRGCGFDPGQVSDHHHGVTRSLVQRMAAMGGHARVESAPGRGTLVRMEWPDERS
ncbi:ATP-binding protein [Kibdelosporangium aridum]|uniref:ATP-binding protein n=2 Tax=Kibdelosporangium aridum TaxID=2030 RepID=A0A428Z5A7_KIBAR|nr:ATP-binding protein [Kibdelosporangium aridum]